MTSATTASTSGAGLTRTVLSDDLSTLLSLRGHSTTQLYSILNPSPPNPTPISAHSDSSALLSDFSPAKGSIEAGVALSAAYTRDMRALQRQGLEEQLEKIGEGIERVRERAEGLQAALGKVKL